MRLNKSLEPFLWNGSSPCAIRLAGPFECVLHGFPSVSTHTDSYEGFDKYRTAVDPAYIEDKKAAQEEIKLLKEQLKKLQERMDSIEK